MEVLTFFEIRFFILIYLTIIWDKLNKFACTLTESDMYENEVQTEEVEGGIEEEIRGEKNKSDLKYGKRRYVHHLMLWQPEALGRH